MGEFVADTETIYLVHKLIASDHMLSTHIFKTPGSRGVLRSDPGPPKFLTTAQAGEWGCNPRRSWAWYWNLSKIGYPDINLRQEAKVGEFAKLVSAKKLATSNPKYKFLLSYYSITYINSKNNKNATFNVNLTKTLGLTLTKNTHLARKICVVHAVTNSPPIINNLLINWVATKHLSGR